MRILGIDPGLNITGYGIIDVEDSTVNVVEAGVIKINNKNTLEQRLMELGSELDNIIAQFRPDTMAVEELYSHYGHPKTAIIMGHARGVIFYKAAEANLAVSPYASTKVKSALTGNGRASKKQMQLMVTSTLSLGKVPDPPDVADALAVALCHLRTLQQKRELKI